MELFNDLIFVAFFLKIGNTIEACGITEIIIWHAFIVFTLTFQLRNLLDTYSNIFYANDSCTRLLYFLFAFGFTFILMREGESFGEASACKYVY